MAPDHPTPLPLFRRNGTICGYALVDARDFARLSAWAWRQDEQGYVSRSTRRGGRDAPIRRIALHREILGLASGDRREGDHIDRNKLNNTRANLRIVAKIEQAQNLSSHRGSTSRYRGVHWNTARGKWLAKVWRNGTLHFLGCFDSEDEAGEAARTFRLAVMPLAHD